MRKGVRKSYASGGFRLVLVWLAAVLTVCVAIRVISATGVGAKLEQGLKALAARDGAAEKIIKTELGSPLAGSDYLSAMLGRTQNDSSADPDLSAGEQSVITPESGISRPELTPREELTNTPESDVQLFSDASAQLDAASIQLDNKSGYDVDINGLLNSPLNMKIKEGEPSVLIVHTHGSEAYTPEKEGLYEESDPYRTENNEYNVVKVGNVLKEELEKYGIPVLHDETLHDYPSYNGSYSRSLATVSEYLEKYPSIKIVIDLHRDAIAKADGSQYRSTVQIGEDTCSQVLLVMGTDASGLSHPVWQENFKLALRMEYAMNRLYPGLAKPILLSQYRYNQHMTAGSMILEVGCTGNTVSESVRAVRYFAAAASQVIWSITEK